MTGWIYVCCPDERYVLVPGVRLRPLPEMGFCLAYTPANPALHRLNATAWLTASLCDGRPFAAMVAGYHQALDDSVTMASGEAALRDGVAKLLALSIVRAVSPSDSDSAGREP